MTEKRNQRELLWFQTEGAFNFITATPHCGEKIYCPHHEIHYYAKDEHDFTKRSNILRKLETVFKSIIKIHRYVKQFCKIKSSIHGSTCHNEHESKCTCRGGIKIFKAHTSNWRVTQNFYLPI
jgi:hypothetical protein